MQFAPLAYRDTRVETTKQVESALAQTANLTNITSSVLRQYPSVLPMLRMATAPPIARDRLIGLAGVSPNLVKTMEVNQRIPPRMERTAVETDLDRIGQIITRLADKNIFPWLDNQQTPTNAEIYRAATIVADRLCGAVADPIIRNSQEQRQLATIKQWLEGRGYSYLKVSKEFPENGMNPGSFSFRVNLPVIQRGRTKNIKIPIDVVIMPFHSTSDFPLLLEAKCAGDYTNPNKRRKEEATKVAQLISTYGDKINFVLFLCGYFDSGYLGYEAAEGIDWVWEHRIDDLADFGL